MWTFLPLKVNAELRAMTKSCGSFDSAVMMSSEMPSAKYSCSASPLMLANGRTAIDGLSGKTAGAGVLANLTSDGALGVARSRQPDLQRVDAHRLSDVLERGRAEIADRKVEPRLHLAIGVFREANCARLGDAFQPRGDVDAVAHEVAVGLLDHVAEVNADAKLDAPLFGHTGVAFNHRVLDLDRAAHRVDHAAKLDDRPVAGAFDDAAVVHGDGRINEIAAQRSQPRQGAVLVRAGQAAEADHVGGEDRGELASLCHPRPLRVGAE